MEAYTKKYQLVGLFGWLFVSFVTAFIGSVASIQAGPFYTQLQRPDWAPPAWIFGPIWTTLYALMGIAAWLVWRENGIRGARWAFALFLLQLGLNALWSWLFFGWQLGAFAFVDIVLLWAAIIATLIAFWRIRPIAGALLVPIYCGSASRLSSITPYGSSILKSWDNVPLS